MTLCPDCPHLRVEGPRRATCCADDFARAKDEAAAHIARVLAEQEAPRPRPVIRNRAERRRLAKLARKGDAA